MILFHMGTKIFFKSYNFCRYYELEQKYGRLDPLAEVNLEAPTHSNITLRYLDTEKKYRVELCRTVLELKKDLEPLVGLPQKSFRIYHYDRSGPYGADELKLLNRKLLAIPIRNGDEIVIELK